MLSGGNRDVQQKTNAKYQQLGHPQMSSEHNTKGFPGVCCCPLSLLPAGCAGCRHQHLFPAADSRSCSSRPSCAVGVSSTPSLQAGVEHPGSALVLGCVLCCVCALCGRGGSWGPPELPGDAVLVFGSAALCWVPCQNGGTCTFPGRCTCLPGWMGRACQTDVDECAGQSHGCHQLCINTAGSYRCACRDGFTLAADDKACQPLVPPPEPETFSQAGPPSEMTEEMKALKSRVEALEQKLQLVLAPFHNFMPSEPEDVGADPISRLSHSLQQLDRIDSLSEQISFLEERLETCSCKNEL
uniref:EGF like domain multiple 7 n=1 Tax=Calidris pygmaea TaxID=425635 RepID=A0A8C3JMK2_9CHAR